MVEEIYIDKRLFTYSTQEFLKKDKIRFYYALKGRDGKSGIVLDYSIVHLGRTVLMVPEEHVESVKLFLEQWKCKYQMREVFAND